MELEVGDSGKMVKCKSLEHFDFAGWDIALFASGSGPTKEYAPKAAAAGCVVIDNSSLYRMDPTKMFLHNKHRNIQHNEVRPFINPERPMFTQTNPKTDIWANVKTKY